MLCLKVFLFVILASFSACQQIICRGQNTYAVNDHTDCTAYYICNNGVATRFNCPAGTFFDWQTRNCRNGIVPAYCQLSTQQENQLGFTCRTANGWFQDPNNCAYFYSCDNNRATRMRCVPGMIFDPTTGQCGQNVAPTGCTMPTA